MALCERLINSCVGADCNNPVVEGAEPKCWIWNKSDIASLTYDAQNPNIITAINMKEVSDGVNAVGYTISQLGKTPFTGTSTEMVEGNYGNTFTETVQFVVPDNSPAASMLLDNMAGGKFLVVMENQHNGADGKGKFQVYGSKKSLSATAMTRELYNDDTNGGFLVTLTAEKQPTSGVFIYTTDDAATRTYLDSLVDCGD